MGKRLGKPPTREDLVEEAMALRKRAEQEDDDGERWELIEKWEAAQAKVLAYDWTHGHTSYPPPRC